MDGDGFNFGGIYLHQHAYKFHLFINCTSGLSQIWNVVIVSSVFIKNPDVLQISLL